MDNVLVEFAPAIPLLDESDRQKYEGRLDEVPGIFVLMKPMPGALEVFEELQSFVRCLFAFDSSLGKCLGLER